MALNPVVFTEKVVRSFLRYQLTAYLFADARLATAVLLLALLGVGACGEEQQTAQEQARDDGKIWVRVLMVYNARPSDNTLIRLVERGEASFQTEAEPSDGQRPRWAEQRYFGSWTEKEGRLVLRFDWHETWEKKAVEDDFKIEVAKGLDPALSIELERQEDGLYRTVRSDMPRGAALWTKTRGRGFWHVAREEFDSHQRVKNWMHRTRLPASSK